MKFSHKLIAVFTALVMTLPVVLTGCGSTDTLYYRYDYDLSDYIKLGEYKGLPAEGYDISVSEETVEMQIQSTLSYFGEAVNLEEGEALKNGDNAIVRRHAYIDGTELADLYEESATITLGFAEYGAAADEALIGAIPGDTVHAQYTPTSGTYEGQTIDLELYVLGGYYMLLPEYTDTFVQAYLDYDSIEAFETALRERLNEISEDNYLSYLVRQTWNTVLENTEVITYPEKEMYEYSGAEIDKAQAMAKAAGVSYETYVLAVYGVSPEEFEANSNEEAKTSMKSDMVCYAIARAENLSVSDEKYTEYLTFLMETYELESLQEAEEAIGKDRVMEGALFEVVMEFVAQSAAVTNP